MMASSAETHWLEEQDRFETSAPGPDWLKDLRKLGRTRFEQSGFPHPKDEAWRFTSTRPISKTPYRVLQDRATAPATLPHTLERFGFSDARTPLLVLVDGHLSPGLSRLDELRPGVEVRSLGGALLNGDGTTLQTYLGRIVTADATPFVALNTAFLSEGAYIRIDQGTVLETPIHVVHLATDAGGRTVSHPRVLALAGAASEATLIETHHGPDGQQYFTNAVTEIHLDEGAVFNHVKIQMEGVNAHHVAALRARQGRDSQFRSHVVSLGGALVRQDIGATLSDLGAACLLNGFYMAGGKQHVDHHTEVDHATAHGSSDEVYKGILGGQASGVFNGRVIVRSRAVKTNASQSNRNLLLSDDAVIQTNPQLEIFADDVKCSHGAAIGQLDPDMMFYLRARGIPEAAARSMLVHAFAIEVLGKLPIAALRREIEHQVLHRLPGLAEIDEEGLLS